MAVQALLTACERAVEGVEDGAPMRVGNGYLHAIAAGHPAHGYFIVEVNGAGIARSDFGALKAGLREDQSLRIGADVEAREQIGQAGEGDFAGGEIAAEMFDRVIEGCGVVDGKCGEVGLGEERGGESGRGAYMRSVFATKNRLPPLAKARGTVAGRIWWCADLGAATRKGSRFFRGESLTDSYGRLAGDSMIRAPRLALSVNLHVGDDDEADLGVGRGRRAIRLPHRRSG